MPACILGEILRDTSVIWSDGDLRHGYQGGQEQPYRYEGQVLSQPPRPPVPPPPPSPGPRSKHSKHRKQRKSLARRGRIAVFAGVFCAALGVAAALAAPHMTATPDASRATVLPQAGTVPAQTQVQTGTQASAVTDIPESIATAAMPGSSVKAKKLTTKSSSSASQPSGSTPAGSPGTSGSGGTAASGMVTAGNSKANCVSPRFTGGVITASVLDQLTSATGISFNCLNTFANPMPTWSDWEQPWMFSTTSDGWDAWLADNPKHQVIMGMDLIPQSLMNNDDPLTWESACASGDYNQYATTLAQNLVSYGAGNIIIRLGIEANGSWEADYTGMTSAEEQDWGKCYANEVTAMRAVSGTHFLFVWNPNICTADVPLSQWYPGNAYVDIIGADAYDLDCGTLKTVAQEGWTAYSTDAHSSAPGDTSYPSLANIESFAVAHGKPLSFPEWGLGTGDDDPTYVDDMAQMFHSDDFAYQSYFNSDDDNVAALGSAVPQATAAYAKDFG
jgi:hypothetical protein